MLLTKDTGLPRSTVHDILHRLHRPSYKAAIRITHAIGTQLGRKISTEELFTFDGSYPTSLRDLTECRGCAYCSQEPPLNP